MRLFETVASVLNIDAGSLTNESNGRNTENWDSLRHIELILAVETAFGVTFSMSEMVSMQDLGDMRELLVEKGVTLEKAA
ncbi:MAG: acyl carrier protein [Anderseniella sp.]|jgi:acyl carrier protein